MTSREVVTELIRRKRGAGRVALNDLYWEDTLKRWTTEGYPVDGEGRPVDPTDHFGLDMALSGGCFDHLPWRGWSEVVEESEEWVVRRNGAGAALKYWKHKQGTPEHIDFRMSSREIWDREYRCHLLEVDRQRLKDVRAARQTLARRREQGFWTFYGHQFIWETMRQSMGDLCMFESLVIDPAWIHDYNRVYTDFYKAHYRILLEEAGKPDGIWVHEDLAYSNGLFCSPAILEELVFPYYKEITDFFHSYDLPVVLHTDGRIEAALPLIVAAGFDALHPMEVKAGCDVVKFAERYGDKLAFCGGLDVRVLESGNQALIRREVTRLIGGMKATGAGYLFGSDHSVSPNVSYADYRFALEIYREQMVYG